jgi:imidazoleglycerol phosphate synthase glutamine amidotransferase subunit HisH
MAHGSLEATLEQTNFIPKKSQRTGLQLFKNFVELAK